MRSEGAVRPLQAARELGAQATMQLPRTAGRLDLSWVLMRRMRRTERALHSLMTLRQSFLKEAGVNPKLPT